MASDTRSRIMATAKQVFARNPQATLEQVAEAAGLGRATLFRYFPNKKALTRTLTYEAIRTCSEALAPLATSSAPPLEKFAQAVQALAPLGAAFHFLTYEPWHSDDPEVEAAYSRYLTQWSALLAELRAAGSIDPTLSEYWVTNVLDVLLYAGWEGIHAGEVAPRQVAALVLRTFFHGVEPRS